MPNGDRTTEWLLRSNNPSVRYFARKDLLGETVDSAQLRAEGKNIFAGTQVEALLHGQQPDGGFGVHPYQKWTGAHWRLVSLVELGIGPDCKPAVKATELILEWLLGKSHLENVPKINGLYRRCASQEGNALAVCSRLGLANDTRIRKIAHSLVEWQWPDGGWNCDRRPEAHHSSFNESLSTMWGLSEYTKETGEAETRNAVEKAAEFFLKHRIFKSCRSDLPRAPETFHGKMWRAVHSLTKFHYPLYWHYDALQALVMLHRAGKMEDERTKEALDLIEAKRGSDGLWRPEDYYWSMRRTARPKVAVSNVEVVDWAGMARTR